MDMDRYNTLKNALIIEKNNKLLGQFKNLIIDIDKEQNKVYMDNYKKFDYMALTIEEEESRVSELISVIKNRESEHKMFEEDYSYITGDIPDFLERLEFIDKLNDLETKLKTIKEYLGYKERIVNLSVNVKAYKKDLSANPNNRRITTKLNKSTKKVNDILNSMKKENILILLYEFCIIDTFSIDEVNNSDLLKNILSTKIKKKKEEQVNKVEKKKVSKNKIKDNTNLEDKSIDINDIVAESKDSKDSDVKEDFLIKDENENKVKEEEKKDVKIEENVKNSNIDNDTQDVVEEVGISSEYSYYHDLVPDGMPILESVGTVRPVTMMEKLESAQESEEGLIIPSMGMLDNNQDVNIDSNDFIKNNLKNDK